MMYYGGAEWLSWITMAFSMIASRAVIIALALWGVPGRSTSRVAR